MQRPTTPPSALRTPARRPPPSLRQPARRHRSEGGQLTDKGGYTPGPSHVGLRNWAPDTVTPGMTTMTTSRRSRV
jgi:hypothetical protein